MESVPPKQLDNAEVLLYTLVDEQHEPTGACRHTVAGELMGPAAGLAICAYEGSDGFYLFYCDESWKVLTDTWHATLEDAKSQAEFEYKGASATWQKAEL
jgi:hypothetical protein